MTTVTSEVRARSRLVDRFALTAIALVAVLSVALLHPTPASAAPQATNATVASADPSAITFKVHVTADADIASATVNYKTINPNGNIGGSLRADVSGRNTDVSVTLQTNSNERYVPVGTLYRYSWSIVDKNGATTATPEQDYTFLDGRYQWQSRSNDRVLVYWYGANEANANKAMEAAATSIANNESLLNVKLTYPIKIILWRNTADSKAAQQQRSASFDSQIITGGSRVALDILHIYDPLNEFEDVVRHETAHVLTKVAGDGTIATLPSWIDEGTAVYAQVTPGGYEPSLRASIAADKLGRLRNMTSATNDPSFVNTFYGESWNVVKFMVDTYGKQKFAGIFKSVKDGAPIDDALQANIGVDQDGLYNAWRKSVGLKTIDFPPIPKSTGIAGAQATQPPLGIPSTVKSADSSPEGAGGDNPLTAAPAKTIGVGIGAIVVAVGLGFAALRLARKPKA